MWATQGSYTGRFFETSREAGPYRRGGGGREEGRGRLRRPWWEGQRDRGRGRGRRKRPLPPFPFPRPYGFSRLGGDEIAATMPGRRVAPRIIAPPRSVEAVGKAPRSMTPKTMPQTGS